jgi:hypothetical protein
VSAITALITEITHEPIFASAHSALTFAYNFAPEQYAPSMMAKSIQSGARPPPSRFRDARGGSLVGMDGAAQAGMILAEVDNVGALVGESAVYFLAARYAPHHVPCACRYPCCVGYRPARAFAEAVLWITHAAIDELEGHGVNYRLRRGLVLRFFGERENMSELAKFASVSRDMASQHNARLLPWFKQHEGAATHAIAEALKAAGITE